MHAMILKVLVGSRAHGLERPESDYDFRGVFVYPTSSILSLGQKSKTTSWVEGREEDATAWELGHFLSLASRCNPTILEVFSAPVLEQSTYGSELRNLFPYIWNPSDVRHSYLGYSHNQRKKMLDDKDSRPWKYASAYIRVLFQGYTLLKTGTLPVDMRIYPIHNVLKDIRAGALSKGQVIDLCREWEEKIELTWKSCQQVPNLTVVNDFLLNIRRSNW